MTPTRAQIVKACIDAGLLTDTIPHQRTPIDATETDRKYQAVCELANLYTGATDPMQSARTAIWNTLNRVHLGLDPLKENRGGARPGSGRKFTKKRTIVT